MVNDITQNLADFISRVVTPETIVSNVTFLGLVLVALILGYALGSIVSLIIQTLSRMKRLESTIIEYGAATSQLWASMINFITEYLKWLIVIMAVNMLLVVVYEVYFISQVSDFLIKLFALIVSAIIGMLLGGIVYKIVKDFLITVGLERELGKHHMSESIAGFSVSSIVAFVVKWYIVLIFLTTGLQIFEQIFEPTILIQEDKEIVLLKGLEDLTGYIPKAILGFILILAFIIISDFVSEHVKQRKLKFSETYSVITEVVIISIGVLLALPHFGVKNTYFLEYSFIILVAGISLGLAFAIGLSFKDKLKGA